MNSLEYKLNGSVAMWILLHRAEDAFIVWMLARKFDRISHNGNSTGRIKCGYFLQWLAKQMRCSLKTADKRLDRAFKFRFFKRTIYGSYLIVSHRRMVYLACDLQEECLDDESSSVSPDSLLIHDQEFTRYFEHWVDPRSIPRTRDLLRTAQLVQGTTVARGVVNHQGYMGRSRRTVQRVTNNTDVKVNPRYIIFDMTKIMIECDVPNASIIDALKEAELLYQDADAASGHRHLHRRYVPERNKYMLAVQIPNVYTYKHDLKKVSAARTRLTWFKRTNLCARRFVTPRDKVIKSNLNCDNRITYQPKVGVLTSAHTVDMYTQYLKEILNDNDCYNLILTRTGASGIKNLAASCPSVWVSDYSSKRDTPKLPAPSGKSSTILLD